MEGVAVFLYCVTQLNTVRHKVQQEDTSQIMSYMHILYVYTVIVCSEFNILQVKAVVQLSLTSKH